MHTRSGLVLAALLVVLTGCPSKEGTQAPDAQTSSSGAPAGSGPLAALETMPSVPEAWTAENGQPAPMIYFQAQNVRISASCKQPNGALSCDAVRQLRGPQVDIPKASLTGRTSAGVKLCMTIHAAVTVARNATGEDSFCRFPDGSVAAAGSLEQYNLRLTP